jgi:hypothetical protein
MTVHDVCAVTRRAFVFALAVSLLAPMAASAQGQSFARVSASIEALYDSNLFAMPESLDPQSDWITRIGPLFEVGYESIPLKLQAHYGFEAERYRTLVELNEVFARQDAATSLNYRGRSFAIEIDGSYVNTQTPSELNLATLQFVGRARAQRADLASAVTFDLSAVTSLKLEHGFTRDSLVGGITSVANVGRIRIARKIDPRTTLRADYRPGFVDFSNGHEEPSHAATAGVLHAFTPALDVEIDGGVRSTAGDVDPEVSAVLRRRLQRGAVGVRYTRTRETTIGGGTTIDVQRLGGSVSFTPTRAIALSVSPARADSVDSLTKNVVYVVDAEFRVRATRRWTLLTIGRLGRQNRSNRISPIDELINYRSLALRSILTLGTLEREDAEPETP